MVTFKGDELRQRLKQELRSDDHEGACTLDGMDFLEFSDLEESVRDDVRFLKGNTLVMEGTKVTGWIHDVDTGKVSPDNTDIVVSEILSFCQGHASSLEQRWSPST